MKSKSRQSKPWIQPLLGAIASVGLLNYIGRQNQSNVLRILFSLWVLGPFLTYLVAMRVVKSSKRLETTMSIITAASLVVYILDLMFMRVKPASPFVAIPPLACLALGIVLAAERSRNSGSAV